MATIVNNGPTTADKFTGELKKMDDAQLLAQHLVQQGGIHAISYLLKIGCDEENAMAMLESLRKNAELLRRESELRGQNNPFELDQTAFS